MERTIRTSSVFAAMLRILPIGLMIILLTMMADKAIGQVFQPSIQKFAVSPPDKADALRQTVRNIYTSQIGFREKGTNAGAEVEQYLRYVHLPKGNPWCAAFVCWVYGRAGVGNPRSGWSPALFPASRIVWARAESGKLKAESGWAERITPKANGIARHGDVFGLYFPEKARIAHVGFIDEWNDPWLTTVEGNTNVLGSREGDGVYRKRRLVRSVHRVARYVD